MISRAEFIRRLGRFSALGLAIVVGSWASGVCGYHFLQGLGWLDSIMNAAMILGGMGPVNAITRPGAKVFASFYALYSGLVLIGVAGLLIAPIFHRFIHWFHIELDDEDTEPA